MKLLSDPRLVNYLIMLLTFVCSVRWAFERRWWDTAYWLLAFALNFVITFRYQQ